MSNFVTSVNPSEIMLENIFLIMENEHFCKDKAAKIVGGEKKLLALIADGKIKARKPTNAQNGTWYCNAADVLRHSRNMRNNKSNR
jgi:hypothetical protein